MTTTRSNNDVWDTRRLIRWTTGFLEKKNVDSPQLAAEMLLAHVLGVERIRLFMEFDRPSDPEERATFKALVERAANHEPVQYLVGSASFYSLDFEVDSTVLIPRPSTATLVDQIVWFHRENPNRESFRIADIGTGSGIIAVCLAKHLPGCQVVATDISRGSLAVAERNASKIGVADSIDFREGSLFDPLGDETFDIIVSNPPYIPDNEWAEVLPNVRDYEPVHALRAGVDGLDVIRPLVQAAAKRLNKNGRLVVEIAASQKQAVIDLVNECDGLHSPEVKDDDEAFPRMLIARKAD